MKFVDRLKELKLNWMISDFLYRMDWRKPNKTSIKEKLKNNIRIMSEIIVEEDLPDYRRLSRDKRVVAVLKWFIKNNIYLSDIDNFKTPEMWEDVDIILDNRKADCESGSLFIYCWLRNLKIPASHIKFCGGTVTEGGHSWLEYCSDVDGKWYRIDWCYCPNVNSIMARDPLENDLYYQFYKTKWFEISDW